MEAFRTKNFEQTDADHRCAMKAASSNDQFEETEVVGKPVARKVVPLLFMEQRKDHFA